MLLLTQSLGVSDIPDLIVAALWGVAAVLAVMTCFQEAAAIAEYWADAHETTDMQTILNGVLHDELFSAHFATWAEMILGIAPEEEDEEGAADDSEGDKTE